MNVLGNMKYFHLNEIRCWKWKINLLACFPKSSATIKDACSKYRLFNVFHTSANCPRIFGWRHWEWRQSDSRIVCRFNERRPIEKHFSTLALMVALCGIFSDRYFHSLISESFEMSSGCRPPNRFPNIRFYSSGLFLILRKMNIETGRILMSSKQTRMILFNKFASTQWLQYFWNIRIWKELLWLGLDRESIQSVLMKHLRFAPIVTSNYDRWQFFTKTQC